MKHPSPWVGSANGGVAPFRGFRPRRRHPQRPAARMEAMVRVKSGSVRSGKAEKLKKHGIALDGIVLHGMDVGDTLRRATLYQDGRIVFNVPAESRMFCCHGEVRGELEVIGVWG